METGHFGYAFLEDLTVVVHLSGPPEEEAWKVFWERLRDTSPLPTRGLVYTDWVPDASYRSEIGWLLEPDIKLAIVSPPETDTKFPIQALAFVLDDVRGFRPEQVKDALDFLQISPKQELEVLEAMKHIGWPLPV